MESRHKQKFIILYVDKANTLSGVHLNIPTISGLSPPAFSMAPKSVELHRSGTALNKIIQ